MTTLAAPVTQRMILRGIRWHTYRQLAADLGEAPVRLAYDRGTLEVMTPSFEHERINRLLSDMVQAIAFGKDLPIEHAGSTDFNREDVDRGFQPDSCFYFGDRVNAIQGKQRLGVSIDPPPDLVLEIDVTNRSLNKLPLYAAIGVPEVWRFDGGDLVVYCLRDGVYEVSDASDVLEGVRVDDLRHFMQLSYEISRKALFFRS
ncbi:MAG: hypothetical protein ETSY2_19840 [Candidatus Entotheonella gemina]|uniref:Putative restriction endonuclease domain-containing protein n=1 Tax=Candidatus Entotheonella gemina TaxID=1429439 RepID=W4M6Z4_9BACT|nr:MAG: hypothetical protein ETSY2_19840 [Candidatus Entotheonella gemina]